MKPKIQTVSTAIISLVIAFYSYSAFGTGTWNWYKHGNTVYDVTAHGEYIWCATRSGIVKWNRLDGTYEQINPFYNNNRFESIAVDNDGVIWIGTDMDGVVSFDPGQQSLLDFRQQDSHNLLSTTSPQKIRELIAGNMTAGVHSVLWDGRDESGGSLLRYYKE